MIRRIVLVAATACLIAAAAHAHHSFPATYLVDKEIKIEGELVAFMFRNPHAFVHLNVKENGKVVRYAIEWGSAGALGNQGITRGTFKAGDFVRIWGNPGRDAQDHRLRMRRIERPSDGFRWGFRGEDFD
jgi:Family of unknown function (DUF6152)